MGKKKKREKRDVIAKLDIKFQAEDAFLFGLLIRVEAVSVGRIER